MGNNMVAEEKQRLTGRIAIRVTPELQQEITAIAETFGVDVSALVTMMIRDARPRYLAEAARKLAERHEAEQQWAAQQKPLTLTMIETLEEGDDGKGNYIPGQATFLISTSNLKNVDNPGDRKVQLITLNAGEPLDAAAAIRDRRGELVTVRVLAERFRKEGRSLNEIAVAFGLPWETIKGIIGEDPKHAEKPKSKK